jgi:hypothetical protein
VVVLRKLGAMILGSLVVVAVAVLAKELLDGRNVAPAIERDREQPAAVSVSAELGDPTASGSNPHPFCCVPRSQINPVQLDAIERDLGKRWPELRSLGRERVSIGDRLAFVVEAGRAAAVRDRELLTGTVLAEHEGMLIVGLGCEPRLGQQHGLCCESLTLVPREAIIAWSKADARERAAAIGTSTPLTLARFVRSGEPIKLVVHTVPGMHWTSEPADAAELDVLEHDDGLVTIALRRARPGRLDVAATAEHEAWGELDLGRWPIVVVT